MGRAPLVSPNAKRDIVKAHDQYDAVDNDLGRAFIAQIDLCFGDLLKNPKIEHFVGAGICQEQLRGFPYVVYCFVHAESIEVIGVLRAYRDIPAVRFSMSTLLKIVAATSTGLALAVACYGREAFGHGVHPDAVGVIMMFIAVGYFLNHVLVTAVMNASAGMRASFAKPPKGPR